MHGSIVVLENIRSAHNVGSVFRTADAAGVAQIYLVGYTPAPVDRFGRVVPEIAKTSLGASDMVPWTAAADGVSLVQKMQSKGVSVVAVEQTTDATDIYSYQTPAEQPVAFVFGNEVDGVTSAVLEQVDHVVELPMCGQKESLNVAVTVGIVLYLTRRSHA